MSSYKSIKQSSKMHILLGRALYVNEEKMQGMAKLDTGNVLQRSSKSVQIDLVRSYVIDFKSLFEICRDIRGSAL